MRSLSGIGVKTGIRYALVVVLIITVIYMYYISTTSSTKTGESDIMTINIGPARENALVVTPAWVAESAANDVSLVDISLGLYQGDLHLTDAHIRGLPILAATRRNEIASYMMSISNKSRELLKADIKNNIQQRLPGAIVVGQRKCGTHALKDFFNVHPQLRAGTIPVEPIFFSWSKVYSTGLERYRQMMPFTESSQVTIEKSPEYFESSMAVTKMRKDLKNVKILIALRDPVERILSDFVQEIKLAEVQNRKSPWGYNDFERVIVRSDGRLNEKSKLIQGSRYVVHVARWVNAFGLNNVHFIDGDILIKDPLTEMKKIETFLGVDPVYDDETFVYDHEKGFMCIAKPYYYCLPDSKGRQHPTVKAETKKKLYNYLKPFTEELFRKYHRFDWPVYE